MRSAIDNLEIEFTEVSLKRSEYETKVVQLVKALLEIDLTLKQQEDQAKSMPTASEMKEAS